MGARHEERRIGVAVFSGMRAPVVDTRGDGCRNVDKLAAAHWTGGRIAERGGDEWTEGEIFKVKNVDSPCTRTGDEFFACVAHQGAKSTSFEEQRQRPT